MQKIQQMNASKFVSRVMQTTTVDFVFSNVQMILKLMVISMHLVIKYAFMNVYQEDFQTMIQTFVIQNAPQLLTFLVTLIWEDVYIFVHKVHMLKTQHDNVLKTVLQTVMLII